MEEVLLDGMRYYLHSRTYKSGTFWKSVGKALYDGNGFKYGNRKKNLALAKRKGNARTSKWEIAETRREANIFEKLKRLDFQVWKKDLNSEVGLLSGGQRQALTLLMATLKKPRFTFA